MDIYLKWDGAAVLRTMYLSCGTADCQEVSRKLGFVRTTIPLSAIGEIEKDVWRPAFERLLKFGVSRGWTHLGAYEVAAYFGSAEHAEIMLRGGYNRLGVYLGEDAGLVTHVLLPISKKGEYANKGKKVRFANLLEMGGEGQRFCHLGFAFSLPLTKEETKAILADQAGSKPFMEALGRLSGQTITIPEEYRKAVECSANEAAQE